MKMNIFNHHIIVEKIARCRISGQGRNYFIRIQHWTEPHGLRLQDVGNISLWEFPFPGSKKETY